MAAKKKATEAVVAMPAHARLSPSSASRWMVCPGSVHLTETLPPQTGTSLYAARGTAIHALAEYCLKRNQPAKSQVGVKFEGFEIDGDMADCAQAYMDFVGEIVGTKHYEIRVSLEDVIPDCFGTVDCAAMRPGHLIIVDLKTGSGNRVDVEWNHQLMLYALGAYYKFSWAYDFSKVTMAIAQPPLDHFQTWTIDIDELLEWAETVKQAYERILSEPTTYVASEKGCKWCRAVSICPEMQRMASEAAAADFANIEEDRLASWLVKIPMLKGFIEAIESEAKDRLLAGETVSGWKVVEGRRTRVWDDPGKTVQVLVANGYQDKIYSKPELLSVAQVEKALKGSQIDLTPLIRSKPGSPTVVPESDKRQPLDRSNLAADDFASLAEE